MNLITFYSFDSVDLLGPFMQLLDLISGDKRLKDHLGKSALTTNASNTRSSMITREDVPQVCDATVDTTKLCVVMHSLFLYRFVKTLSKPQSRARESSTSRSA